MQMPTQSRKMLPRASYEMCSLLFAESKSPKTQPHQGPSVLEHVKVSLYWIY